jgi:hypothetical protein
MKLSNIYFKEFALKEFANNIEEEYAINEMAAEGLTKLINAADTLIFEKFKIKPTDRSYFIAGSARLYVHQELRDLFELTQPVGDLDIVIPNKETWVNAGLGEYYEKGGIYRPDAGGMDIEVFDIWDPSKAGGDYADVKVRSTQEIMSDTNAVNGYFFMSLYDVIDYKMSLNRGKEKEVIELIGKYNNSDSSGRVGLIRAIVDILGMAKTKEFLGRMKK